MRSYVSRALPTCTDLGKAYLSLRCKPVDTAAEAAGSTIDRAWLLLQLETGSCAFSGFNNLLHCCQFHC